MQASIYELDPLPASLQSIPDAPTRLFASGTLPPGEPVAIVGSRRATEYGRRVAKAIAAKLASRQVPIVSGLAFGIDAASHQAALAVGGRCIAVLPSGLARQVISPQTHLALADQIRQTGMLLSEYSSQTSARKEHYVARNRLISGLARCVVVVEAALPSGSLLTARHALEQGKDVWAVPGLIDNPVAKGTNQLIADGAFPLVNIEEFMESLGLAGSPARPEHPLLAQLGDTPIHIDALEVTEGKSAADLGEVLTKLELLGLIKDVGGRYYVRVG